MAAKNLSRKDDEGIYSHIYNRGSDNKDIFRDPEDRNVFLGYLAEYLTPPQDPKSIKKEFVVGGRTFQGTPHLPKNYFGRVELIAYSLKPDQFDLLLHQLSVGSLENFIRSLCTRYSIYFNKKYQRIGALFAGPYKSSLIADEQGLLDLTLTLHHSENSTSYPDYVGERITPWVNPRVVLAYFNKGPGAYRDLVHQHLHNQPEKPPAGDPPIAQKPPQLEKSVLTRYDRRPRFVAFSAAVFILLFSFGIHNVLVSAQKFSPSSTPPVVLSATASAIPETIEVPKTTLTVKTTDKDSKVNIHQQPAIASKTIATAKDGEIFEYISTNSKWTEIKLSDGTSGFISTEFIVINSQ